MNKIVSRLKLIYWGDSLKDKFFLTLFSLLSPLKKEGTDFLFKDVIINIPYGKFISRKKKDDISIFMGYDDSLKDYLTLKEGVFLDIGSHIGKYAIKVGNELNNSGKVIAIELMPDNYKILKLNIGLNHLGNVIPLNLGCDSEDGEKNIYGSSNNHSTVSYSLLNSDESKFFGIIPVKRIDTIVSEQKLDRLDLIKIDVEGAELSVLNGGLKSFKKFKPRIIIETDREKIGKIKDLLKPLGYEISEIDGTNLFAKPV